MRPSLGRLAGAVLVCAAGVLTAMTLAGPTAGMPPTTTTVPTTTTTPTTTTVPTTTTTPTTTTPTTTETTPTTTETTPDGGSGGGGSGGGSTVDEPEGELPVTGLSVGTLLLIAGALLVVGVVLLRRGRSEP
jgi:hypothetical protein